ncbi:aprataxin and PNK-like factor isoform X3 [Plutella xylostella]|uniref:aprataxin and PNK-like factor isoform X3 n=1 Tax=Plutella xylostella TaxID=51655 RepID=UPI0020325183|nr:aprataxin and PNK-like factor isoform X3 [Plutella xylostella]
MKMVFRLLRVDCAEPCKIQLSDGVHKFGRGIFLDCEDRRVSRRHGELRVAAGAVALHALHQNPCFYIKKETEDTEILRKDETVNLSNGDRFGLLPGSYWYELLELPDSVEPTTTPALTTSGSPTDTACGHTVGEPHKESPTLTQSSTEAPADPNESAVLDFQLNDTLQADPAPGSPSLLGRDEQSAGAAAVTCESDCEAGQAAGKRRHATSDEEAAGKRPRTASSHWPVKTEPPDGMPDVPELKPDVLEAKLDAPDVKPDSPDVKPDVSKIDIGASAPGPSTAAPPPAPPAGASPAPPDDGFPRERCFYGADCYRKNPVHRATYRHPGDADWAGAGAGGEPCRWGAACRRRDPRHWEQAHHPPGTSRPRPALRVHAVCLHIHPRDELQDELYDELDNEFEDELDYESGLDRSVDQDYEF